MRGAVGQMAAALRTNLAGQAPSCSACACRTMHALQVSTPCLHLTVRHCRWENVPATAQPALIADGRRVAIKHCLQAHGGGRFPDITTLEELRRAGKRGTGPGLQPAMGRTISCTSGPVCPFVSSVHPPRLPLLAAPCTADDGQKCLDRELEMLQRLHDTGCGERVVCPLAQTRWAGWWSDDPDERAKYWWEVRHVLVRHVLV